MEFGAEAGYWPWALIMSVITVVLLYGLRTYYDRQDRVRE